MFKNLLKLKFKRLGLADTIGIVNIFIYHKTYRNVNGGFYVLFTAKNNNSLKFWMTSDLKILKGLLMF